MSKSSKIKKVGDNYKMLPPELSRQITKDECSILNFLKRKQIKESKKYRKRYGDLL